MRQLSVLVITLLTLTSFGQDKDSVGNGGTIFVSEPMPSYPGGYVEMYTFIKKNLKYSKDSRTVQEKVFIEFIVNEDGSLSDFKVAKGLGEPFDNSALETMKKMPNWIPAKRTTKLFRQKW